MADSLTVVKKLIFTHFLLNIYILAIVQPALPVLEYMLNYNYIVSELCENRDKPILTCNGKCYLEKQVEQQLNLSHNKEAPNPPKVDYEKFISINEAHLNYALTDINQFHTSPYYHNKLNEYNLPNSIFRPPIA